MFEDWSLVKLYDFVWFLELLLYSDSFFYWLILGYVRVEGLNEFLFIR